MFFHSRISPSIREKMKKVNPKVVRQVVCGYDTEYKNESYGKNKLVSAQLAISGNLSLEITTRTNYAFDIINTDTCEKIKSRKMDHMEGLLMSTKIVLASIESSISMVRFLKYGSYDELMSVLVEELKKSKRLENSEDIKEKGRWLFKTPSIPLIRRLLLAGKVGLKWESLLSEIMCESGVMLDLKLEERLLSDKINIKAKEGENLQRVLKLQMACRDYEGDIVSRKLVNKRSDFKIKGRGLCKDIQVVISKELYLISHFNVADLSMIEDWDEVKRRNIDIIGKSFVSIMRPIKSVGYKIYIRDTMLLASAAAQSLEKIGVMHKMEKIKIDSKYYSDMGCLLESDRELFKKYAMKDSEIVLAHGLFVLDFSFKLGNKRIPVSLGSLSRLSLKKH